MCVITVLALWSLECIYKKYEMAFLDVVTCDSEVSNFSRQYLCQYKDLSCAIGFCISLFKDLVIITMCVIGDEFG